MPTITLNRKVFEKAVGKKLPNAQLKDRISMLGTDLESVSAKEIVVEVFPNRPDMLSEHGFARAFSSFIGKKKGFQKYVVKKSNAQVIVEKFVQDVRPLTVCAIVKNLKLSEDALQEIINLQEKLHITYGRHRKKCAIGVYPLDKIKFPVKYTARDPKRIVFVPLDMNDEMDGNEILSSHPKGKLYASLLDGKNLFPVFVDAAGRIMSMPPIINAETVGKVTTKTKDVFIECSGFDLDVLKTCLNIIVTTLSEMGGDIYSVDVLNQKKVISTPELTPRTLPLNVAYYNKWLGITCSEKDIIKYLERMGFGVVNKQVLIPSYRADILHQVDLAEDIAIAYGYENFDAEIPKVATIAEESPLEIFREKIIALLNGLGYLETSTYHIAKEETETVKMRINTPLIYLANALNEDFSVMRAWMLPSLMQVLSENTRYEYPQKIGEIGRIFREATHTETGVEEPYHLALLTAHTDASFTEVKQALDALCSAVGIQYTLENVAHDSFLKGRVAKIIIKNKDIGYLGEIHPEVITNFKIEVPVAALELDVSLLFEILSEK